MYEHNICTTEATWEENGKLLKGLRFRIIKIVFKAIRMVE